MNKTKQPAFAILNTKPVILEDLPKIAAHNNRTIPVPNADSSVPDGVRVLRLDGSRGNLFNAVTERIEKAGVQNFSDKRYAAFEVVLTYSNHADPRPSREHLEERGTTFMDETFGRPNVVAIWGHYDEATDHLHGLVVPISKARKPGRTERGTLPKAVPVVSWNRFSGSYLRKYSRGAEEGDTVVGTDGRPFESNRGNKVMAMWQSKWAATWSDYGLRRGVSSSRKHIPTKRVQGKIAEIKHRADVAEKILGNPAEWLMITPEDWREFQEYPFLETLTRLIAKYVKFALETHLSSLRELAFRGIQLDATRQTLVELQDRHEKLEQALAGANSGRTSAFAALEALRDKFQGLQTEVATLRMVTAKPEREQLVDHLADLPEVTFQEVVQARQQTIKERERDPSRSGPKTLPHAPTPLRPAPRPSLGHG